ncbi:MAG: hypothetical protein IJA79_04175 [Desulfovibrio sp.]|nr:hypothetical protein [Desulfovibrio sp.]
MGEQLKRSVQKEPLEAPAYIEAVRGGKHGGWYKIMKDKPENLLQKSRASLQKQVDEHRAYIKNPQSHVKDWEERDERYKTGMVKVWNRHIQKNQEQLDIVEGILAQRGNRDGK